IVAQFTYLAKLDGTVTKDEQQQIDEIARQAALAKDPHLPLETPANRLLGITASYWLDINEYQPAEAAKHLQRQMLILQGGRDYQVTAAEDLKGWQCALEGRNDVSFKLYPMLNHLFMAGTGPSSPAEYSQASHVDVQVINDIAQWVAGCRLTN
ncbi:MAG TPA: hypothetical protein VGM23_09360, partial [Armatimonadota bacterium]